MAGMLLALHRLGVDLPSDADPVPKSRTSPANEALGISRSLLAKGNKAQMAVTRTDRASFAAHKMTA